MRGKTSSRKSPFRGKAAEFIKDNEKRLLYTYNIHIRAFGTVLVVFYASRSALLKGKEWEQIFFGVFSIDFSIGKLLKYERHCFARGLLFGFLECLLKRV